MTAQRYEDAERQLRNAIQLNPKLVKANYQLGLLLARTGRKDEADRQLALAKSLREEDEATLAAAAPAAGSRPMIRRMRSWRCSPSRWPRVWRPADSRVRRAVEQAQASDGQPTSASSRR